MPTTRAIREAVTALWRNDAPLTAVGLVMIAALPLMATGLVVDDRVITGAPAWLKPAKFAVSTAIYSFTLAWMFGYLGDWVRLRALVSRTTAIVFVVEVGIICLQAWRGTTSHFNVSTRLDAALFAVMGVGIALQTLASALVAFALFRQHIDDQAMGAALRAGMVITLLGASTGGLMTSPSADQIREASRTGRLPIAGAHTVGGPDGGPGLPVVRWSREHGDLRAPHFIGLHAMQALPLLAVWLHGRARRPVRLVRVVALSYGSLFLVLLLQALRGEPLLDPGAATTSLAAAWLAASLLGLVLGSRTWELGTRTGRTAESWR